MRSTAQSQYFGDDIIILVARIHSIDIENIGARPRRELFLGRSQDILLNY